MAPRIGIVLIACLGTWACNDSSVVDETPCDPNPCTNPPAAACNGNVAETYGSPGACNEQDHDPICTYPVSESTDCAAGGQVCDPESATCVDCVEDADCQSPFLVCQNHACAAGCIDDAREPNDDVASASAVQQDAPWADMVLCAGTEDYYAIVASEGDAISALIDFVHADGDLDLELIGPDGSTVVASSASSDDGEVIEDFDVDAADAGTYTFRVFGHTADDQNVYDLLVTLGANACIPDPCTDVPADECEGNSAVSYRAVCTDVGGAAQCSYPVDQSTDCGLAGQICDPET
ncbi:MAG: PPC domain-containing protein, partial [Deltaproteobacteria bacterium]|nr:PPC domain-containing protein [Deltaproteobacteria bacterium]